MIIATNTIRIRKGHADEVAERFKNPKGVQHSPGFIGMELLKLDGNEEHDELKVVTRWDSREAFEGWVRSDAFKQAHGRRGQADGAEHAGGGHPGAGESVMLGSKLSVHEVLFAYPEG